MKLERVIPDPRPTDVILTLTKDEAAELRDILGDITITGDKDIAYLLYNSLKDEKLGVRRIKLVNGPFNPVIERLDG